MGEWGAGTGNKKHNLQVQNRQQELKNSIGNGEVKEHIHMTHGHEHKGWENAGGRMVQGEGGQRGEKNETTIIS